MTKQAKIVSRIRKLLALSGSDNANEAATAASMADKLMREHAVSLSSLDEADLLERDPVGVSAIEVGQTTWAINLAWALASHCNVSVLRCARHTDRNPWTDPPVGHGPDQSPRDWEQQRRRVFAVAYGHRSDLEVWEYLYAVAKREFVKLVKAERARITERDGWVSRTEATQYREGLVIGLKRKLYQQRQERGRADRMKGTDTALVLQSRADRALAARDTANPDLGTYKGGVGGARRGVEDGQRINLNPGLQAKRGAKLIGGGQ